MKHRGRHQEALEVALADKAAIVGRLMLGELSKLDSLFEVADRQYAALPRRSLRSAKKDVRDRLSAEIDAFCRKNFEKFSIQSLASLFDDILPQLREFNVAAMPMPEFEKKYGRIREEVLKGVPRYSTVVISARRGLQYQFPEDQLAKDIVCALDMMKVYAAQSVSLSGTEERDYYARQRDFAARACVGSVFNLLEAYLSGILWENLSALKSMQLSRKDRRMVDDPTSPSLVYKLTRLPELVTGKPLPKSNALDNLKDEAKPFRDSLTHPSPFYAPENMGGYHKLSYFHAINGNIARATLRDGIEVVIAISEHLGRTVPPWVPELRVALKRDVPSDLLLKFKAARKRQTD